MAPTVQVLQTLDSAAAATCMERVVRAAARSDVVTPEAPGSFGGTPEEQSGRFSIAYLISLAARFAASRGLTPAISKTKSME
jgi:hypothetical protein